MTQEQRGFFCFCKATDLGEGNTEFKKIPLKNLTPSGVLLLLYYQLYIYIYIYIHTHTFFFIFYIVTFQKIILILLLLSFS